MKALNKLVLTASALLAAFASAQADVTLHITGSTAYRNAVHNAIAHILTGPTAAYNGSSLAGANQAVFKGTISGVTGNVIIETNWTGSISGIAAIAANTSIPGFNTSTPGFSGGYGWINPSNIPSSGATVTPDGQTLVTPFGLAPSCSGGVAVAAASIVPDSASTADTGLADSFQSSTPYSTAKGYPNIQASNNTVGIIPFVWVKNAASTTDTDYATWQRITNITALQAKFLYGQGFAGASLLTGNSADTGVFINALGRDTDSGTRLDAFAESAFGIFSTAEQYIANITSPGVSGTFGAQPSSPSSSALTATLTPGAGGDNSGGTLAKKLATPGSDASDFGGYLISYLGVADADGLLAPAGTPPANYQAGSYLTFNGVSCNLTNINNGTYQFWAYEHYLTRPSGFSPALTSDQSTVSSALQSKLLNVDAAVAGYKLTQVHASKPLEGGVIAP